MVKNKLFSIDNANKNLEIIYQHYMLRADDNKVADKLLSEIEDAIILLGSQPL